MAARWATQLHCRRTRNYFAGGPDTVRGYRENDLGPRILSATPTAVIC